MTAEVQSLPAPLAAPAAGSENFIARLFQIARKGILALADQSLFSGANFLVNVVLARWLSATEYGAYSLAFAVFLLFSSVHSAILIEPMLVFGVAKYAGRFPNYLRVLLWGHASVMAPASALLFLTALALRRLYSPEAAAAFLGLVFAAGTILLFWLVRRVFYVLLQPSWGVAAGALYFVLLLGSVATLQFTGHLSVTSAFLAMGTAGLLTSIILLVRIMPSHGTRGAGPGFKEAAMEHWRYGRWAMATAVIGWFPGQVYYALLPAWLGLEGSAGLRAMMNFVMPVVQAISALSMLLLPMLTRDRHTAGVRRMNQTMLLFLILFCAGAGLYLSGLWIFRDAVFNIFYGGKYKQYAGWPLLLTGLLPLATCATAVLGNALRALERPDCIFWCYAGSVIGAVAIGIPFSASLGVSGALLGLLASSIITALMMAWFYRKSLRAEGAL